MSHSDSPNNRSTAVPTVNEATAYASLSQLVYADRPLADTLDRVAVLATHALSEVPEVSLTLLEDERAWTAATSGPIALGLDGTQYATTSGPCLDAARCGETIKVTTNGPDQPYPRFRRAAQQEGVTHTMSIGFSTGDQVMGAMNIYNSTGRSFSDDSERIARAFAVCAGIVLANVDRYRLAAARASHLEIALLSRAPIDQAKGILMTRHRCTSEEAFKILLRRSQDENVKLRVIAQSLVDEAASAGDGLPLSRETSPAESV
jgi:transcriptional regulator with GAF, ATPase, and Fis domain